MKVVNASYEIMGNVDGIQMLKNIEKIARTCYKSEDKITDDSYIKMIRSLVERKHEAMLEHASVSVLITCDRGCCYSDDTYVLTNQGFIPFCNITEDCLFATLDDNNNLKYIKASKFIKQSYNGIMQHWKSTQIDCLVTPNHNMWLYDYDKRSVNEKKWKFIKSENAKNKRYKFNKSINQIMNTGFSKFIIEECNIPRGFWTQHYDSIEFNAEYFFELLGWWLTDGCIYEGKNGSGNRIIITQVKNKGRDRIKLLLESLNLNYSIYQNEFRINSPQLYIWLKNNFYPNNNDIKYSKTYDLSLPRWIFNQCNKSNLEFLLNGIIGGDGSPHSGNANGVQIYTASKSFAQNIVEIALLIGRCANIHIVQKRIRTFPNGITSDCKKQYVVSVIDKKIHLFYQKGKTKKEDIDYSGFIYCVELPKYHKLYVMRNGKSCWCGNSHELVRHRLASFAQESTRYCNYGHDNEITVIKPCFWEEGSPMYFRWHSQCGEAEQVYLDMLKNGAQPQEARSVLPNSLKTEINITMNLREWRHFFKLRACGATGKPHPQMLEIAVPMLKEFQNLIPIIFDDLKPMEVI